jgi:signal transduction histidine kinase
METQLPTTLAAARSSNNEPKSPTRYHTAAAEFKKAADNGASQAQAIIAALHEHASDIAHDMKNPLNGVLALSQNVMQVRASTSKESTGQRPSGCQQGWTV